MPTTGTENVDAIRAILHIEPYRGPAVDWDAAGEALGVTVPADFRTLIDATGPGVIGYDMLLLQPFAVHKSFDQIASHRERTDALATIWADEADYDDPEFHSKPAVFDEPGVRPVLCGASGLGFYLWWIARDDTDPADWQVAVEQSRGGDWRFHSGTVTDLLLRALRGETGILYLESLGDADQHFFTPKGSGRTAPDGA